jgi:hypothetical protein
MHRDTQGIRGGLDIIGHLVPFGRGETWNSLISIGDWNGCLDVLALSTVTIYDTRCTTGQEDQGLHLFPFVNKPHGLHLDLIQPLLARQECFLSAKRLRSTSTVGVLAKEVAGQAKTQGEPEVVGNQGNGEACVKCKTAQETVAEQENRFHMKVEHRDPDLEP